MSLISIPWTLLEEKHIVDYLIAEQIDLVNQYPNEESPQHLKTLLHDVCAYIQSRVPSQLQPNPMAPNHVPLSCKTIACHLVIEALQSRLPNIKLSEDQIRNAQQARETLDKLCNEWKDQLSSKHRAPRLEAVRYRRREAQQSTLKGF